MRGVIPILTGCTARYGIQHKSNAPLDFPGGPVVKNLPANAEEMGLIPGPGRFHIEKLSSYAPTTEACAPLEPAWQQEKIMQH